jgi:hypothetical protein
MAISQAMTTSFKRGVLEGVFNFASGTSQVFKIALYTSSATLGASTTAYSATNEVASGGGYTTGGETLTISQVPTTSGTTAFLSFSNVTWSASTITARGALIYLSNGSTNPSIAVLDFGTDQASTSGNFTISFPTADATNAIIRIA